MFCEWRLAGFWLLYLESSREEDFLLFFSSGEGGDWGEGIALIRAGSAGSVLRTGQGSMGRYLRACTRRISALHMLVVATRGGKSGASRRA